MQREGKWSRASRAMNILIFCGGDFPGCSVVRAPCFYCRRWRFNPWSEKQDLASSWAKKTITFFCEFGKRPNFLNSEQWTESKRPSASPILKQPVWDNSLYRFKDVQKSVKKGSRVDELEIYVLNYELNQDTLILIWSGLLKSELLARKGKP